MPKLSSILVRLSFCLPLVLALRASADILETSNGAREVGKIISIREGVIVFETEYAGEIKVKQSLVTAITSEHSVAVRLADGTDAVGTVSTPTPKNLKITSPTKTFTCTVDKLAAWWSVGQEDPDIVAKRRKWSYEAGADINGRMGTERQLSTSYHYRAKLVGPEDTFQYYTAYTRQDVNNQVSADQFKAGVDYFENFTPTQSWYMRDEAGFDRVNFITLYDIAATGFGYDFIKIKDNETLTGRLGVSYRYDQYQSGYGSSLGSAGADVEVEYMKRIKKSQLTDKIAYVPAFQDMNNYQINHEFNFEVPLTKSLWKLSTGVSNTYYSKSVGNADKLETLYFTRLILVWGYQPSAN